MVLCTGFAPGLSVQGNGLLHISELSRVTLAGMVSYIGSPIFARSAAIPVGGNVTPGDVFYLEELMASKPLSQGENTCPAGSRFTLDTSGAPIPGKCRMCESGTVSLATSHVGVRGQVADSVGDGARVVLVGRGSPNAIQSFPWWNRSLQSNPQNCTNHGLCLGIERPVAGRMDPVLFLGPHKDEAALTFENGMFRVRSGSRILFPPFCRPSASPAFVSGQAAGHFEIEMPRKRPPQASAMSNVSNPVSLSLSVLGRFQVALLWRALALRGLGFSV